MKFTLKVVSVAGIVLSEACCDDEIVLVYRADYAEGDRLLVETSEPGHILLSLDAGMPPAQVFMGEARFSMEIPFGIKRKSYPTQAFSGDLHRISARRVCEGEISARRNLAFNPFDHHENTGLFPHASANVETRGEAVFAARNAIDGEKANTDHGFWPYTSWGINQDPAAALTVTFGRPVLIDQLAFYLRADFPHDAWWEQASVTFSDGDTMSFPLLKTGKAQTFAIAPIMAEWIMLQDLKKAEDPSPFPALTQIEVWGVDIAKAARGG